MIEALSKYLPLKTLNALHKRCVRPYLDYGDVIFHITHNKCDPGKGISLNNHMDKLESV